MISRTTLVFLFPFFTGVSAGNWPFAGSLSDKEYRTDRKGWGDVFCETVTLVILFLTSKGAPEPLVAIYEPRCLFPLGSWLKNSF